MQDIFQSHRFEEQLVRRIIIGADRLRIGIDHNAFITFFPEGKRGMDAAVVEFNALANTIRPAAQDNHLGFC